MDYTIVLQGLGIVLTAIFAIWQLRNLIPKTKSALKIDLDIFHLIEEADPNHAVIKKHIDKRIVAIYVLERTGKIHSWGDFIIGLTIAGVFSILTVYLVRNGFSWWSLLTGPFALVGIGGILNGLEEKASKVEDNTASAEEEPPAEGETPIQKEN